MVDVIVAGIILLGFWTASCILYRAIRCLIYYYWKQPPTTPPVVFTRNPRREQQNKKVHELKKKYRELQIALLHIEKAPDFQRAAAQAEAAQTIPKALRQRQYRRFRPQLVKHFSKRLQAGADAQILLDSLTTLVESLGMASFEASYIQQEASRQGQRSNQQPAENFSSSLERIQQEHADRATALNEAALDPDTKQQLIEAQNQHLVESLMEMTVGNQGPAA